MSVNRLFRVGSVAVASLGVLALSACGSDPQPSGSSSPGSSDSSSAATDCPKGTLNAEGSTAQKNAIDEIISKYNEKCADVTVNYNPTGSGAGIKQFNANQVDFAGSDSALKPDEMTAATKRCGGNPAIDLPMVVGPITIAYNIDGVTKLILDGPTAAKIFQGAIKNWNDPAIAKLNPGVTFPSAPISVFFRSDESGTTENFTKYLKAAGGGAWTAEPAKKWAGTGSGKEKSSGVAEAVKSTKNSITYDEWSYAIDNKLGIALIDNGSGTPVELSADSAAKALTAAKPADATGKDLALKLDYATKAPGTYPIVLVTYEIACTKGLSAEKTAMVKSFLSYFASSEGQSALTDLNYGQLPDEVRTKVTAAIQAIS